MTPTCNTCGTKFPGKDRCKSCGADPNAPSDLEARVRQMKKAVATLTPAVGSLTTAVKKVKPQIAALAEQISKVPAEEFSRYERCVIRAKERSMRSTSRKPHHGAHRG